MTEEQQDSLYISAKTAEVNEYAETHLSEKRYRHSIRTAEYAEYLALLHKETAFLAQIAYFTGLAHDITKELSDEEQLRLAAFDGCGIDNIEQTRLNLLHGRTAAVILKNEFGITNSSILNAVRYHTFGMPNADQLAKIIYVADKIEPGRKDAEDMRQAACTCTINELTAKVIVWNSSYIKEKGCSIHPFTEQMLNDILKSRS